MGIVITLSYQYFRWPVVISLISSALRGQGKTQGDGVVDSGSVSMMTRVLVESVVMSPLVMFKLRVYCAGRC